MADLQNAMVPKEPKERPLKMAQRNEQGNGKKPFWSSKVHGIPQGYNTNRPSTLPPNPQQTGALAMRPKSANQAALERREVRLAEKEKEASSFLSGLFAKKGDEAPKGLGHYFGNPESGEGGPWEKFPVLVKGEEKVGVAEMKVGGSGSMKAMDGVVVEQ